MNKGLLYSVIIGHTEYGYYVRFFRLVTLPDGTIATVRNERTITGYKAQSIHNRLTKLGYMLTPHCYESGLRLVYYKEKL